MKSLRDEIFRYAKGLKNQGIYFISFFACKTFHFMLAFGAPPADCHS